MTLVSVPRLNCIGLRPERGWSGPRRSRTKGQVKKRIVWTGCFSAAICTHAPSRSVELALLPGRDCSRKAHYRAASLESVIHSQTASETLHLNGDKLSAKTRRPVRHSLNYSPSLSQLLPPCIWAPRADYKSPRLLVSPNRSSSNKTIIWRLYWNTAWVRTAFSMHFGTPCPHLRYLPLYHLELDC